MIKLEDLVGVQMLDAVDYGMFPAANQCLRMRLCGVIYVCEEDPDDGYRSHMKHVRIDDPQKHPIVNVIPMTLVDCKVRDDNPILEIYDRANGKLIIEVGTDHTDDYYPSCVLNWNPENLYVNEEAKRAEQAKALQATLTPEQIELNQVKEKLARYMAACESLWTKCNALEAQIKQLKAEKVDK